MAQYDLVVVGGGAAGLVAARETRRRGATVAIVQAGPVGGDCTFTGCVPSKALLSAAGRGLSFSEAMAAVRRAVERVAATEDEAALRREGIDLISGFGRFLDPGTVDVEGRRVQSKRFVVAAGARPFVSPVPGLRELGPLTSETLFELPRLPAALAVLGGGSIGCEMAQAFARLGSRVTVLEGLDRVLPQEEPDASAVVSGALTMDGAEVRAGGKVTRIDPVLIGGGVLHVEAGAPVEADAILAATGRAPSGQGLGLEDVGVEVDERGAVVVDDTMATSVPGIWAAGDVVGRVQFTHAAARMGWTAAANALSKWARLRTFRFDERVLPWATFTSPEVGRVGLTEAQAAEAHPGARVAHLPFRHLDRAVATGDERGFVTLVAAPRRALRQLGGGQLVGATVVGPTGGDLIHEVALAMRANLFTGRLAQTTHAYPTWSMAIQQAALQFFGPVQGLRARPAEAE